MDELELREVADGVWTIGGGREWRPGQGFDAPSERPATVRLPSLEAWAAFELGRSMGAAEPRVVVPGWQEAVQPQAEPEPEPARGPSLGALQNEYQKLISWGTRPDAPEVVAARAALTDACESEAQAAEYLREAEEAGLAIRRGLDEIKDAARRFGVDSPEVATARGKFTRHFSWLSKRVDKVLGDVADFAARQVESAGNRRIKAPLTTVEWHGVEHRIDALAPSKAWTVALDETGKFDLESAEPGTIVALVVPDSVSLPALPPNWHGKGMLARQVDAAVQTVLDQPVGLIALRGNRDTWVTPDAWATAVLEAVDVVLRLLPLGGTGRAKVEVCIEQRGIHAAGASWQAAFVQLLRALRRDDRVRYDSLEVTWRFVKKGAVPLVDYADAVAFTYGSPVPESKARRGAARLAGFQSQLDARSLEALLTRAARGHLDPVAWRQAVADPAEKRPRVVEQALTALAQWCRGHVLRVRPYLTQVQKHADSKAVSRGRLRNEVQWLLTALPPEASLPTSLQLELKLLELEEQSHRGAFSDELVASLDGLMEPLRDEAPARVCQADLVIAVTATNQFRFDVASRRLRPWLDVPMAVPGRLQLGRVQSSLGQHAAFTGDAATAITWFDRAIATFGGLSDPEEVRREQSHTGAYRAIAYQDAASRPEGAQCAFRDYASLLIGGLDDTPLDAILGRVASLVASEVQPQFQYLHHATVRALFHLGTPAERAAYTSLASVWASGTGHPWPLIEGYRALLLAPTDLSGAQQYASLAEEVAFGDGEGPTVRFIAHVLAQAFELAGLERRYDPEHYQVERERLMRELPDAPWSALEAGASRSPLELLRAALPFNFR